jgi:hypothetical protein
MRLPLLVLLISSFVFSQSPPTEDYLSWSMQQANEIAQSTYHDGKVGSRVLLVWTGVDTRWLKTERAQNYKLRATWFTPEVIRATSRFSQIQSRLREDETKKMVSDAEAAGDTVVMVEIDPSQGSGVIPPDWEAFLQPVGATKPEQAIRGAENPDLRKVRALQGVRQRNYDYDRFWMIFPLVSENGELLIPADTKEVDLIVRIYNREGNVRWVVPQSVVSRMQELAAARRKENTTPPTAAK